MSKTNEKSAQCTLNGDEIFVVSIDTTPSFYTKSIKEATRCLWEYASRKRFLYTDHCTYLHEKDASTVRLMGYYRFFIISYDYIISEFQIHKVTKLNNAKTVCAPRVLTVSRYDTETEDSESDGEGKDSEPDGVGDGEGKSLTENLIPEREKTPDTNAPPDSTEKHDDCEKPQRGWFFRN